MDLNKILDEHKKWLMGKDGARANLRGSDLREADLREADLSMACLRGSDLRGADLREADLSMADLSVADLSGAYIDYSCLPLWCGGLKVHMDERQIKQLMYHTLSIVAYSKNVSKELKDLLLTDQNLQIANEFHRAKECGLLTRGE